MKYFAQCARAGLLVTAAFTLTACASLQDVDNKWCPPEAAPVVQPAPVQQSITLQADALFKFDRGDVAGLLPQGQAQLDALAQKLQSGYASIDGIAITGYTDRLGPQAYNQRLSQQRADSVMHYLQSHGVDAPMVAAGKGEANPVTSRCEGDVATNKLIACLQPDRRVDLQITGIK